MRKEELRVNTLYFSERFGCYGQCIAVTSFMAYMIFANPKRHPPGWYHCVELGRSHIVQDEKVIDFS